MSVIVIYLVGLLFILFAVGAPFWIDYLANRERKKAIKMQVEKFVRMQMFRARVLGIKRKQDRETE